MLISEACLLHVRLLTIVAVAFLFSDKRKEANDPDSESVENVYDYIIVGAGSSGALLASRLARETRFEILLLEAGKGPTFEWGEIPAYAGDLQRTEMNWGYLWEPQPNFALGLKDFRLPCPRGKTLGGSSAINYMIHGRGNPADFDSWGPGWSFQDLHPFFKRYENYTVRVKDGEEHGDGGPLSISDVPHRSVAAMAFVGALREFGYDYIDYNGGRQIGVSFVHATLRRGVRHSAYSAFLEPLRDDTDNLMVLTGSMVTRILVTPFKKAYGVVYVKGRKTFAVHARKEVIICGGAINSPQLLMLSGIGPKKHLKDLGIKIVKDLPVGEGLRDHIGFLGLTYTLNESVTFTPEEFFSKKAVTILKKQGKGPLTIAAGVEALGMVDTKYWSQGHNSSKPNIEYVFFGTTFNIKGLYRISEYTYERFWKQIEGVPAFTVVPLLYRSESRGYIKLRSSDPFEYPLLHGEFYTDLGKNDIKTMISAIRLIQKIVEMSSLRKLNATLLSPVPGCEAPPLDSDQYWECALRQLPTTFYEPQGTCRMEKEEDDDDAVVDSELRVRGVKNLRVVDASVFPGPVSGHINGVCYAVAEKIGDLIVHGTPKRKKPGARKKLSSYGVNMD